MSLNCPAVREEYAIDDQNKFHVYRVSTLLDGTVKREECSEEYAKPVLQSLERDYREDQAKQTAK